MFKKERYMEQQLFPLYIIYEMTHQFNIDRQNYCLYFKYVTSTDIPKETVVGRLQHAT